MDFGFAHGADTHINNLRGMFSRRPTTTLVNVRRVNAVQPLITHLNTTAAIAKPIGDILLGAHANDEGQLFMPMVPGQNGPTRFETLESTLTNPKLSILIPDALIGFVPGNAIMHAVHIKGCNIGNARPFLVKLKEALGGNVKVTAPKFFHGATPEAEGMFEYVGYQFALKRTKPFPKRPTALSEFDAAQFTLVDGSPVDAANWNALVPRNPNTDARGGQARSKLGVTIGKRTTINTPQQYRVATITFGPWTITYPPGAPVPKKKPDQVSDLEISLGGHPLFQSSHPFPQFTREGFANVIEFVSGYEWTCTPRGRTLVCVGTRLMYVIVMAVTDPTTIPASGLIADGNIFFNFYPNVGSALPAQTTALRVNDPRFFTMV
jgi:hypothetical protein